MKRAMWIVWPSFLAAGLLEALVFAVVDPAELLPLLEGGWTRTGLYSATFLLFWAVMCGASALSLWLAGALGHEAQGGAGRERASALSPAGAPRPA